MRWWEGGGVSQPLKCAHRLQSGALRARLGSRARLDCGPGLTCALEGSPAVASPPPPHQPLHLTWGSDAGAAVFWKGDPPGLPSLLRSHLSSQERPLREAAGKRAGFSLPTASPLGPGPPCPHPCSTKAQCQPLFPGQPVSGEGAISVTVLDWACRTQGRCRRLGRGQLETQPHLPAPTCCKPGRLSPRDCRLAGPSSWPLPGQSVPDT